MKIIDQIWTKIKEHKKIVCLAHINPDGDAYASSIALYFLNCKYKWDSFLK